MEGSLGRPKINCPVCGRGYVLEPDSLVFYSDRPLKLLRIKKKVLLHGRSHDPLWKCIADIEEPSDEEFLEELRVNGVIP